MRTLLLTSALVAPLVLVPALAQEAPAADEPDPLIQLEEQEGDEPEVAAEEEELEPAPDVAAEEELEPAPDVAAEEELEPAPDVAVDAPEMEPEAEVAETIVREQAPTELRVDWITGTTVVSTQDETIGQIGDLIIDQETNQITAAILSVGGFLGIGAKQIAVNFDELMIDFDAREISLNLTRDEADAAPEYAFRERAEPPPPPEAGMMDQPMVPAPAN